ncbi:FliH/SctL family protein (plasmid) [Bradyrhizobium sp. 62B]|uniref:FliH/SctL family protein n=1 Tax=Bradyrhizobium sp. 62B TaxID=2898442 RepID=UPI00324C27BA|nr:FliH/SctL family protein [Bradyrhizobium sp. 62B]
MVTLVQLTSGAVSIAGRGRVLPAATMQRLMTAEQVLAQARREAEELVSEARGAASMIQKEAREAGGQAAQAIIQERLIVLAMEHQRLMHESRDQIIEMGLQIARRIIGSVDPAEATLRIAWRGLQYVRDRSTIRLRVAPSVAQEVRQRLGEIALKAPSPNMMEVVADSRIEDAGCILETDAGRIDATIESQLAAIEAVLREPAESAKP